jgi:hypothetical protein
MGMPEEYATAGINTEKLAWQPRRFFGSWSWECHHAEFLPFLTIAEATLASAPDPNPR